MKLREWVRQRREWLGPAVVTAALAVLAIPRMPGGVCVDDGGDLQTACATLGIAHPPSYPLYALCGHILTRLLPLEPAYVVTLASGVASLAAIYVTMRLLILLGVSLWVAAAAGLLLGGHWAWQSALLLPEVYGVSALLLAWGVRRLVLAEQCGRAVDLVVAMGLLGTLVVSRPPMVVPLAAVGLVLQAIIKQHEGLRRRASRVGLACAGGFALPIAVAAAVVLLRDGNAAYNYVEEYAQATGELPAATEGITARVQRAWWLMSGQHYREYVVKSREELWARMGYVGSMLARVPGWVLAVGAVLLAVGWAELLRRSRTAAWLVGMLLIFTPMMLTVYDVDGSAADPLPLLLALATALSVAVGGVLPRLGEMMPAGAGRWLEPGVLAAAAMWTWLAWSPPAVSPRNADGRPILRSLNFETLPREAVVVSEWPTSTVLWYGQHVQPGRRDVRVVNAAFERWPRIVAEEVAAGRRTIVMREMEPPEGFEVVEYRGVWEVRRAE